MSEPKLISPLLDGFIMGAPISQHDGVRCCPAIREDSDNKYIVKIISVPSSQNQLDALLLTGAYTDAAGAMEYFKDRADGVEEEARILRKLSEMEGFLAPEQWQTVPMEGNDLGYDVYLLSPYRLSLEKYMRRNAVTHLNAVNLGLDLCAAAAICRNAGYMYVDFKPSNIFISEDKEYRIGDLGFVKLDSLKYNSMPGKYISRYTAPEVLDPLATLNDTVDIYSIGLVLYQVYNNGELPFGGNAVAEVFPAPVNADYEMAEILAKACAPDPADRWKDPMEMGQALVDYMQRNTVNDTPIAPPRAKIVPQEPVQEPAAKETPAEEAAEETDSGELAFMEDLVNDETAPSEEDAAESEPVTEEVTSMLAQADELIAQEVPETVAPQETIRVSVGAFPSARSAASAPVEEAEEVLPEEEEEEVSPFAEFYDDEDDFDDEDDLDDYEEDEEEFSGEKKPRKKTWVVFLIIGILLALLCFGGFYLYRNFYIQTIDSLTVDPYQDQVTVHLESDIDDSLLTVACTDTYGNSVTLPVQNGQVVFTGLQPNTHYRIEARISGSHKLEGSTSVSFTSEEQTKIEEFTAITGPQDGSVVLEFSVTGHDVQDWVIHYTAEDVEPQTLAFTGHMVTINGLTVGKTYTFALESAVELYLVGDNTLEFTASSIVLADDLKITAISGESLTAQWETPEDTTVESWTVRCYSDNGYDRSVTTEENTISFDGLTPGDAYTVEVTAAGMTQPVRTTLTANPVNITSISVDDSDEDKLVVSWEYTGEVPEGGWLLMYTMDNGDDKTIVSSQTNSAEISPRIPGATYHFEIQTAASGTVFNGTYSYACPNADVFREHGSVISRWLFEFCRVPNKPDWTPGNIKQADYVNTFKVGEKIGLVMVTSGHWIPEVQKQILFVIRDAEGNVVPDLIATQEVNWKLMWNITYPRANLTLPKEPTEPGEYKLYLYFDGAAAAVLDFTVTE